MEMESDGLKGGSVKEVYKTLTHHLRSPSATLRTLALDLLMKFTYTDPPDLYQKVLAKATALTKLPNHQPPKQDLDINKLLQVMKAIEETNPTFEAQRSIIAKFTQLKGFIMNYKLQPHAQMIILCFLIGTAHRKLTTLLAPIKECLVKLL